jgi:hypothetical protein
MYLALPLLLVLVPTALAAGCGGEEIIVQLFRPSAVQPDDPVIKATQGSETRQLRLADEEDFSFDNCDANRIRIVPKEDGGPVTIKVMTPKGIVLIEKTVQIPASGTIKLALGKGLDLVPRACAPPGTSGDGGLDGTIKHKTGSTCTLGIQCEGGKCLQEYYDVSGNPVSLPGKYCSRDCSSDPCPTGEYCYTNKDGLGKTLSKVCLKECTKATECRQQDNYDCTPGGVCLPK